jgi:trehalose synthase
MQIPKGHEKYLVDSVDECADRILHLIKRIGERADYGRAGREHVRQNFLIPRLVRDELRLIKNIL